MPLPPPPNPPPQPPPLQPFNYQSFGSVKQELANRLYDPNKVFWNDAELGRYVVEALRTWNALTGYWRADFDFTTSPSTIWYDLFSTNSMPKTQIPSTLADTDLYPIMLDHLLEPQMVFSPAWTWTGSAQFTVADFTGAMQRRLNELLSVTDCSLFVSQFPATLGRTILPDNIFDLLYVFYLPAANASPVVLWKDDNWSAQVFSPVYAQLPPGLPQVYMQSIQPPITFDVYPPVGFAGNFEFVTVDVNTTFAVGQLLGLPNDWTWVLKWGALADLLSRESNAKDVIRAQYCEQRYQMGILSMQKAPALLALKLNGVPLNIDTVYSANRFNTSWRAASPGPPTAVFYAGMNLLALNPPPDTGGGNNYSLTATVVCNAIIPVNNTDFIQIGREDLDVIIDYAQHLASFKMGGEEFLRTMSLLQRFLRQASIYGLKLSELGEYMTALLGLAARDKSEQPVIRYPEEQNA